MPHSKEFGLGLLPSCLRTMETHLDFDLNSNPDTDAGTLTRSSADGTTDHAFISAYLTFTTSDPLGKKCMAATLDDSFIRDFLSIGWNWLRKLAVCTLAAVATQFGMTIAIFACCAEISHFWHENRSPAPIDIMSSPKKKYNISRRALALHGALWYGAMWDFYCYLPHCRPVISGQCVN